MSTIKKVFKNAFVWLCILSILFIGVRMYHLTSLPIFTDEAIYIRWSQIGATDASWRYISLTDGKQPLFTWCMMAALRVISDPLVAGRTVSVFSGLLGMWGMFAVGYELFKSKRVGLIASFLYFASPFSLMYDRLAIYDSLTSALYVWNIYIAILLVRYVRLDIALIFGMSLALGMLNKSSGFLSLYLQPFTLVLFDWKKQNRKKRLWSWVGLSVVAAILSQILYSVLRLSPYFYIIAQKNTIFVYPFKEWITHPFTFFIGNVYGLSDWFINYVTVSWCILALLSFMTLRGKTKEKMVLVIWWVLPFVALALFGKVLYARYLLPMAMPILILTAVSVERLTTYVSKYYQKITIVILCCLQAIYMSSTILTDISRAVIPKSDIGQLINDWPSGWGVREIVTLLDERSKNEDIAVYTEGTFGLLPYALEIYLHQNKKIEIHGVWPPSKSIPDYIAEKSKSKSTYYITNLTQEKPDWPMDIVLEIKKAHNEKSHIRLYKIRPAQAEKK